MNLWNLILLLVFVVGHAELWVALINRLHALPLGHRVLRQIRHLHDVAILTFPLMLFWQIGINGPRLLTYGQWHALSAVWTAVLTLCALGVVALLASVIRHQWRTPPAALAAEQSVVVDVAELLGRPLIAPGPYHWMARLPGNEQFTVELSEKRFVLPRLPDVWDGLRVLHLSDWHLMPTVDRGYFEAVTEMIRARPADLILFTGDLADDLCCLDWLPSTLGRIEAPLGRYFILGNHDWMLGANTVRSALADLGWQDIGGRTFTIEFEGRRLVMGGDETPWIGDPPDFSLSSSDEFRLLASHTPDHFRRARMADIDLMLAGHNHGGQVALPIIGPVYAPSRYGTRYADGVFAKPPTVMHVSRGLAGCHPFRRGCPPEVTWLVLEREKA